MSAFHPSADIGATSAFDPNRRPTLGDDHHCEDHPLSLSPPHGETYGGNSVTNALEWARRSRIEAARAIHPATKAFLLELAEQFEVIAGEAVRLDPDDPELQRAVAERLTEIAAKKREWSR